MSESPAVTRHGLLTMELRGEKKIKWREASPFIYLFFNGKGLTQKIKISMFEVIIPQLDICIVNFKGKKCVRQP